MTFDLIQENARLEQEMIDSGIKRFMSNLKSTTVDKVTGKAKRNESQSAYGAAIMRETVRPLAEALIKFCEMSVGRPGRTPKAIDRLLDFDPYIAAFITSKTIIDSLSNPQKFVTLALSISKKLYDEEYFNELKDGQHVNPKTGDTIDSKLWYNTLEQDLNKRGSRNYTHRAAVLRNFGKKIGKPQVISDSDLSSQAEIGKCLIDLFALETGLIEKIVETKGNRRIAYVYPSALAEETIHDLINDMQDMQPDAGPMVVEPLLWSDPWNGGYRNSKLRERNPLIHSKSKLQYAMMKGYDYNPLNSMCQSAWRINTDMLEVLRTEASKAYSDIIPSAEPMLPAKCPIHLPEIPKGRKGKVIRKKWFDSLTKEDRETFFKWKDDARQTYTDDKKRFSQRSQLSRILKLALKYIKYEAIWFNHFLCYRGRKYAIGTLSPQGCDYAKAVIEPKDSELLGPHGLKWMKIHLTGVYGYDKVTIEERIQWCKDNQEAIHAVADDPFGSVYDFWKGADKPFQFVAACKELSRVWKEIKAGFPAEYCHSRMIAAQDGSCNGIQHFSAMLMDEVGGSAVNLINRSSKPNDIYGDVSTEVLPILNAEKDPELIPLAGVLKALTIDRSTCKRQTMIIPYGGTMESCKDYSRDWVVERLSKLKKGNDKDKRLVKRAEIYGFKKLGGYLATAVWKALQKVVVGSLEAMKFIQACSRAVVAGEKGDKNGELLYWTTAIGFPVVQDVKQTRDLIIDTRLCGKMQMSCQVPLNKIDKAAMRTKIAPNFVHSYDSCHMSMAINYAREKFGINFFACIHDSYGTHVGKSEELAIAIRESFIDLYTNHEPLKAFWEHCKTLWEQYENPAVKKFPTWESIEICMGNLDINEVRKSKTFFL